MHIWCLECSRMPAATELQQSCNSSGMLSCAVAVFRWRPWIFFFFALKGRMTLLYCIINSFSVGCSFIKDLCLGRSTLLLPQHCLAQHSCCLSTASLNTLAASTLPRSTLLLPQHCLAQHACCLSTGYLIKPTIKSLFVWVEDLYIMRNLNRPKRNLIRPKTFNEGPR